jgi:energy-coupling factor transport system ATP-binding protein
MDNDQSILSLKGVTYRYPGSRKRALKDINLEIKRGEFVGIVGRNGSGRSTLCYSFNSLIPNALGGEFEGEVRVRGVDPTKLSVPEVAQWVGLVFSNPEAQLTQLSVWDEIAFGPANLGWPKEEIQSIVQEMLKLVQLDGLQERDTHSLSGGQQQRLAIASVLAMRPEIIILDEATSNLDPQGVREVYSTALSLNKEHQTTIVFVDHAVDMLAEFASRIIVMDKGAIVADGTPEEVLGNIELLDSVSVQVPEIPLLFHELRQSNIFSTLPLPVTVDQAHARLETFIEQSNRDQSRK